MQLLEIRALHGPNVWARFPVLEVWVDLQDLNDSASDQIPGFNDRLMSWLPGMIEHRCSVGQRGGFFERLRRGTYLAHILEHVTLELQSLSGSPMGFGRARSTTVERVYRVAIRFEEETLARECLRTARELCLAAVYDRPFDVGGELRRLRALGTRVCLGPSTRAIVRAAEARHIPVQRLNTGSLVQLGHGVHQRRIRAAETDSTGAIAQALAQDKALTKMLLRAAGVPVPPGRAVNGPDDAWAAAQEAGLPVVVKPRDANHGRGVAIHLSTRAEVVAAYHHALQESEEGVLVERCAVGAEHRLLIVGGKLVAAARGEPEQVTGDGRHNVIELVDQLNGDPRRGDDYGYPLSRVELDAAALLALQQQGYQPGSIPAAGVNVVIHHNGDLTTDETSQVHPDVAAKAILAARVIGLDVAGIDLVAHDIGRPLEEQGGVVVEVNAGPGLQMHVEPQHGQAQPVGEAIVATLFPHGQSGRVPLVGVTGTRGKAAATRLIAHLLAANGLRVGAATGGGAYLGSQRLGGGSGAEPARCLLLNPLVEAAVCEITWKSILHEGLPFDECDVAVVTNLDLSQYPDVRGLEMPAYVEVLKRAVVEAVHSNGTAVLNAADPLVVNMAGFCPGRVTYFARRPNLALVTEHLSRGGKAVYLRRQSIRLAVGSEEFPLDALKTNLRGGGSPLHSEIVLAAVAAAWSLGLTPEQIGGGLQTFSGELGEPSDASGDLSATNA